MKLSRHTLMAAVMLASGLVFTMFGDAHAQRAVYRTVSGHGHGYGHGCPCPTDCPPADGEAAPEDGLGEDIGEDMGEDLPEVADLTSDAAFASASQSAAPNAIGDSLHTGFALSGIFADGCVSPAGARRYKATNNNSALPQCRVYYNYNYFDSAQQLGDELIDVHHHEFGAEWAFWCDMASIQVSVPFNRALDSEIDDVDDAETDTEFGNVMVALKAVMLQDCCKTVSAGVAFDIPTAEDINYDDLLIENDVLIVSPFLALLYDPGCCFFSQAFAQVSIPTTENSVEIDDDGDEIRDTTLLYLDGSVGYWLHQDCCCNGVAAIAELHYTNALDDDEVDLNGQTITTGNYELLNATFGLAFVKDCWSIRPAYCTPLLDDEAFDWELELQINRRF